MIDNILQQILWGNTVLHYLTSFASFIAIVIAIKITQHYVLKRLKRFAKTTDNTFDDFIISIIYKIALPMAYFVAFFIAISTLNLTGIVRKGIDIVSVGIITIFVVRLIIAFMDYGFSLYWKKGEASAVLEHSIRGMVRIFKSIIWGLAIVFYLDNLGFKISAVIAGLGIGGVAVALAAQAVLGDVFSYFSILFDRPFEIGDFIITDDYLGTIEYVGIKTTRIRSLSGEQLIFSNSDLTNSRVRNYKRMEKRRVVFKLGVTYNTSLENLKLIPKIIENIVKNTKDTVFDRAHFFSYGDFSLIFEVVYYVCGSDYNVYMDIQQKINYEIKENFEAKGIEFAYPTQTLYVNKSE